MLKSNGKKFCLKVQYHVMKYLIENPLHFKIIIFSEIKSTLFLNFK